MLFANISGACDDCYAAADTQACFDQCASSGSYPGGGPPPTNTPGPVTPSWVSYLPGVEKGAADIIRALNPPPVQTQAQPRYIPMPQQQLPPKTLTLPWYKDSTKLGLAVGGGAVVVLGAFLLLRK